jgi:nanoRNase/pAp phosphatase (c-di-AMP/oligoRNAs hydrolase)
MLNQVQQIFERIKKSGNTLITFPAKNNGDCLAGALAMSLYLSKLQKRFELIAEKSEASGYLSFLPNWDKIKNSAGNLQKFIIALDISKTQPEQVKYVTENGKLKFLIVPRNGSYSAGDIESYAGDFKYDLIISLGAKDLESLGNVYEQNIDFFYKTPLINIDNSSANEEFGQINLIDLIASSNSEILFYLLKKYDISLIDEDIATCLLSGIIISTKSFKAPNVSPATLEAAAQLISMGARRDEVNQELFRSRTFSSLKLWGRALARLSATKDSQLVWSILNYSDMVKTGSNAGELSGIIEELITNIPQSKLVALFYEDAPEPTGRQNSNAIIYTLKNIDAGEILKKFNPVSISQNTLHIKSSIKLQELASQTISLLENYINMIS